MDYVIAIPDQLAPQLRSLRKARRMSQSALALALGVAQSRIAAIERNPAAVSAKQLMEILRLLGADLVLRDTREQVWARAPGAADEGPKGEW